jgi:serine/threonine-protein kinase
MPIVARFQHPSLLPISDFGVQDGRAYLVMEYVAGGSLEALLERVQFQPLNDSIDGILQMCQALAYIHQQGVVHHDVEPSNMLLAEAHRLLLSDCWASVTLAKWIDQERKIFPFPYTPQYLAPEQIGNPSSVDLRSDLYSLGIVFYQAVTGRVPFGSAGDTPLTIVLQHIRDPLPPPSQFVPDLPPQVEQVIMKALEKDPNQRYQSATEMMAALGNLAEER